MYNAFVLLKYNENIMERKLLARLEAEKDLYEQLKATEMLQDMRKRVNNTKNQVTKNHTQITFLITLIGAAFYDQ